MGSLRTIKHLMCLCVIVLIIVLKKMVSQINYHSRIYSIETGNITHLQRLISLTDDKTTHVIDVRLPWKQDLVRSIDINATLRDTPEKLFEPNLPSIGKGTQQAIEAVMKQIQQNQKDTVEIDLTMLNESKYAQVSYPSFLEFGKPGYDGENGTGVDPRSGFHHLNKEDFSRKHKEFFRNNFDEWVSRKIPLHRSLFEARTQRCQQQHYSVNTDQSVSVIIVFYNEAWTTLLRSIHSILDTSPKGAIKEIILLDDCSTQDHLKAPLEKYLQSLKHAVRFIRAKKQLGVINARNVGYLYASGDILVFLDSHIECFHGWLEPLIAPILLNPRIVTFPVIEIINRRNFQVVQTQLVNIGNVDINTLAFSWRKRKQDSRLYHRSPTMPGGLYAVSKHWFHRLGAYDPELKSWGGENIEFSFKTWMCGGSLLLSRCSHIGHIFRPTLPFAYHNINMDIQTNRQRVAEVWMDSYKHFYYEKLAYNVLDTGNVTSRRQLRESLQCRSFQWYLDNVNNILKKEMDPEGKYIGTLMNKEMQLCLCKRHKQPDLSECKPHNAAQVWQLTTLGHIANSKHELTMAKDYTRNRTHKMTQKVDEAGYPTVQTNYTYRLKFTVIQRDRESSFNVVFDYDENQRLREKDSQLCLDVDTKTKKLMLSPCSLADQQQWAFQTRDEFRYYHFKRDVVKDFVRL